MHLEMNDMIMSGFGCIRNSIGGVAFRIWMKWRRIPWRRCKWSTEFWA